MKNTRTNQLVSLVRVLFILFVASVQSLTAGHHTKDKIKDAIEDASDSLKKTVDKMGDNLAAAQEYLEKHHSWKGMVEEKASSNEVTLSDLRMNDHKKVVIVKPGQEISCKVHYLLDHRKVSDVGFYRAVIGIKGVGAQTTAVNCLGAAAGEGESKFTLVAPCQPGLYQVRFRPVNRYLENEALAEWCKDGREPDASTNIGIIYVK